MDNLIKALIVLAVLSFIMAVIGSVFQLNFLTPPEGWSRACSNLALIAIALCLCMGARVSVKGGDAAA